jgi:hypothetical protein
VFVGAQTTSDLHPVEQVQRIPLQSLDDLIVLFILGFVAAVTYTARDLMAQNATRLTSPPVAPQDVNSSRTVASSPAKLSPFVEKLGAVGNFDTLDVRSAFRVPAGPEPMPPPRPGYIRAKVVWFDGDSFWVCVPTDCTADGVRAEAERVALSRMKLKDWGRLHVCVGGVLCLPADSVAKRGLVDGGSVSMFREDVSMLAAK